MLCLQVLGMLPKGPLARSSFSQVGAGPVQHASTRNRLMRKLGMGSSKPGPARSANVVRRVNVRPYPIFTHSIHSAAMSRKPNSAARCVAYMLCGSQLGSSPQRRSKTTM